MRTKPATFCDICGREVRRGHLKKARRVQVGWLDWCYDERKEIEDICSECWPIMVRAALEARAALAPKEDG